MPTIAIESDLYKRVEKAVVEHRSSVGEIFAGAVRLYLWELDRRRRRQLSAGFPSNSSGTLTWHGPSYILKI